MVSCGGVPCSCSKRTTDLRPRELVSVALRSAQHTSAVRAKEAQPAAFNPNPIPCTHKLTPRQLVLGSGHQSAWARPASPPQALKRQHQQQAAAKARHWSNKDLPVWAQKKRNESQQKNKKQGGNHRLRQAQQRCWLLLLQQKRYSTKAQELAALVHCCTSNTSAAGQRPKGCSRCLAVCSWKASRSHAAEKPRQQCKCCCKRVWHSGQQLCWHIICQVLPKEGPPASWVCKRL